MRKDDVVLHYRIVSVLGRGGMGEVYLAEDTRLKRQVALKVLPEELAGDPVFLQRFRVEAEAAAKLNHPNIAQVYAIEEASPPGAGDGGRVEPGQNGPDGQDGGETESGGSGKIYFITMEYVPGRPLHDHLSGTPLPLESFHDWFIPVVEALDHAHERGVVHRDLKPANVMISDEGVPKILDFGLARIAADGPGETAGEGVTLSLTQAGAVMGTPAYMSPEQATGNRGDHRSDIFSLGVMMYEALTGSRPFAGDNYVSVISSTLKDEPAPVSASNRAVSPTLNRIVRRCLAKETRSRYQSALDVGHVLADSREEYEAGATAERIGGDSRAVPAASLLRSPAVLGVCAACLVAGALVVAALTEILKVEPAAPLRKFQISLDNMGRDNAAISPDGSLLAYVREDRLWVRSLDQDEGREIPGADGLEQVFWSPDSRHIGYRVRRSLWKVAVDGSGQVHLCDLPNLRPMGVSWGGDGQILFSMVGMRSGGGLYAVSDLGGDPVLLIEPDAAKAEGGLVSPLNLAEYNLRLYAGVTTSSDPQEIADLSEKYRGNMDLSLMISMGRIIAFRIIVDSPETGRSTLPLEGDFLTVAGYAAGHLLYYRETTTHFESDLWAVPFSPRSGELTGEAFRVARSVHTLSVSDDGAMVYRKAFRSPKQLALVDRRGRVDRILGRPQEWIGEPVVSPDQKQVVVEGVEGGRGALWLYDLEGSVGTRLTFDDLDYSRPSYTSDGGSIMFAVSPRMSPGRLRQNGRFMRLGLDGMSEMTPFSADSLTGWTPMLSDDGRFLVYSHRGRVMYISTEDGATPQVLLEGRPRVLQAALSPDSRYLAYVSDQGDGWRVYVTRFPTGTGRWQVSEDEGLTPRWSHTGKELFYVEDNRIMAVPLEDGPGLQFGRPEVLFDAIQFGVQDLRFASYDVTGEGESFVIATNAEEARPSLTIVQNWMREFDP